jgi:membrane-bound inhibitor of C-type lysozyme
MKAVPTALCFLATLLSSLQLPAADLTLHLSGEAQFSHRLERVECDANGATMGLPRGVFTVEYVNGGDNSLAIVPVSGKSLIFANVVSGSGARYVARQYTWWDAAGRGITFTSDWIDGKKTAICHVANK